MVHDVEVKGLDADGEGDLLFLLKLLLGLGHLTPGILNVGHAAVSLLDGALGALAGSLLLLLLSLHHGLPLLLSLLQALPLLLGLLGLFVSFLLPQSLLLFLLLLGQLLLLLGPDFLPLGLLLLQPLELLVKLALLGLLAGLEEVSISLLRGVGGNFLLLIVLLVRHDDCLCAYSRLNLTMSRCGVVFL